MRKFKKAVSLILALTLIMSCFMVSLSASAEDKITTVQLDPGVADVDDPVWFAWTWGTISGGEWLTPVQKGDKYVFSDIDDNIIFVRMPSGTIEPSWTGSWVQTNDLTIDGNTFTITDVGAYLYGEWSTEEILPATEPTAPATEGTVPATEGTVPATDATEPASENQSVKKVYFTNNRHWSGTIYCYYWTDNNSSMEWPGVEMKDEGVNVLEEPYYSIELPVGVNVIFTNGTYQTVEGVFTGKESGFYPLTERDARDFWYMDSWTEITEPTEAQQESTEPASTVQEEYRKIYFSNNYYWSGKIYCYAWTDNGEPAAWPGLEMKSEGTNTFGEPYYSVEVPVGAYLIFNNISNRSNESRFTGTQTGFYLEPDTDSRGYHYVASWTEDSSEPTVEESDSTEATGALPNNDDTVYLDTNDVSGDWYAWTWDEGEEGCFVSGSEENGKLRFEGVSSNILFVNTNNGDWSGRIGQTENLYTMYGGIFKLDGSTENSDDGFGNPIVLYNGYWEQYETIANTTEAGKDPLTAIISVNGLEIKRQVVNGDKLKVTFKLTADEPIIDGQAALTYDKTKLTLESWEFPVITSNLVSNLNNGAFNFVNSMTPYDFSKGDVLVSCSFTVAADAEGEASIDLEIQELDSLDTAYVRDSRITADGKAVLQSMDDVVVESGAFETEATEAPTQPATEATEPATYDPVYFKKTVTIDDSYFGNDDGIVLLWTWYEGDIDSHWIESDGNNTFTDLADAFVILRTDSSTLNTFKKDYSDWRTNDILFEYGSYQSGDIDTREGGTYKITGFGDGVISPHDDTMIIYGLVGRWISEDPETEPFTEAPTQPATEATEPATESQIVEGYYVTGSAGLCGEDWISGANPNTLMKRGENNSYYLDIDNVAEGLYEFKIIYVNKNGVVTWHPGGMGNNSAVTVVEDGSRVRITYTPNVPAETEGSDESPEAIVYAPEIPPETQPVTQPATDEPTQPATDEPTQPATEATEPETEEPTQPETEPVHTGAVVKAGKAVGMADDTVEVPVIIENNPGIVGMTLKVTYNESVLTLTEVKDGKILGTSTHKPELTSPYTLAWANDTATTDFTANGTAATLVFKINSAAAVGDYEIGVSYKKNNFEIYNKDMNEVEFDTENGQIQVIDYILGDVDGNKKVNNIDRLYLTRYLADWKDYKNINMEAADVDGNGIVNNRDRVILTRHLADWADYRELPYKD